MRYKPQGKEFEILDKLDEKQIIEGSDEMYHKLNDLVSLSYCGILKIAKTNDIKIITKHAKPFHGIITARVKIHNPHTRWTGYGASQCKNTLQNQAFDVAVKKAFRNAIRLSFPPAYLRNCLDIFRERRK